MTWVALLFMTVFPGLVFVAALSFMPSDRPVPRWRTALADHLDEVAERLRHRRPVLPDPFAALRVQQRLGVVANYVQKLEADTTVIARAERIIASQLAYDYLLEEACKMAGVEVPEHAPGDPSERFREEVELASRGWAW